MAYLVSIIGILALGTIATMLIVFGYKQRRYEKKIDFLSHFIEKGYESDNIDLNNL